MDFWQNSLIGTAAFCTTNLRRRPSFTLWTLVLFCFYYSLSCCRQDIWYQKNLLRFSSELQFFPSQSNISKTSNIVNINQSILNDIQDSSLKCPVSSLQSPPSFFLFHCLLFRQHASSIYMALSISFICLCLCFKSVSRVFRGRFKTRVFQGCFKTVSRVFQGCFKRISRVLQDFFKDVSRIFQECL